MPWGDEQQDSAHRGANPNGSRRLVAFALGSVLRTRLLAVSHALRVEYSPDDVIANPGKIANTATAHKDDGVLLKVVTFAGYVGRDFDAIGKPHTRHLAKPPNWASWVSWSSPASKRPAFAGTPAWQDAWAYDTAGVGLFSPVD